MVLKKLISLSLFLPMLAFAEPKKHIIYDTVFFLQSKKSVMDHRKAVALSNFAHRVETELQLDWRKAVAIIYQESSFQTDPQDCLRIKRICYVDIGIGQTNWKLWNRVFKIERLRLASDYEYALDVSFKILEYYKKKKGHRRNWHEYFHSGTPSKRKTYRKRLKKHYDKIVVYTRGYADGRYDTGRIRRINFNNDTDQKEELYSGYFEKFVRHVERGCKAVRPPLRSKC